MLKSEVPLCVYLCYENISTVLFDWDGWTSLSGHRGRSYGHITSLYILTFQTIKCQCFKLDCHGHIVEWYSAHYYFTAFLDSVGLL